MITQNCVNDDSRTPRLPASARIALVVCLIACCPASANTTSYLYDNVGRVIRVTLPDGSYTAYTYDSDGNRNSAKSAPVNAPPLDPSVTSSIDSSSLTLGGADTVFRWRASNATIVQVACTGSVSGLYKGSSLEDAIYARPVSVGNGLCSATARNAAGQTATSSKTVTVQSNSPNITSSVDSAVVIFGGDPTVFRWSASNAITVQVVCTGSVSGSYTGPSLENGIYARPVSVGTGLCSANAINAAGQTATTSKAVTVQADVPSVTSSVDSSILNLGGDPTIFRWRVSNATMVQVVCTGSVRGSYTGPSLDNGIYAQPVSLGSGVCSVTAVNENGSTVSTANLTVI